MENHPQFVQFLIKAKQNTYAGDGALSPPSRPVSKDLTFRQGDYLYLDTYLGDEDFIGEEAVWHQQKPIWAMNYYGWMLVSSVPRGFGQFLKKALQNVPVEAPYRGPAHFQDGPFEYACTWQGDIDRFEGQEQILFGGKVVYQLLFHGGSLR
jgi:hypothetical protein